MNSKIKLLIFDFDGTIADSATGICNTVNQFLKENSKSELEPELIKAHIGLGLRPLIEEIFSELDESFLEVPHLYDRFLALYEENYLDQLQPFDGAKEFFEVWPGQQAIVSNKFDKFLRPSLDHMGLTHINWVDVVGRNTYAEHKPHPLPLEIVMKKANVSPAETLMIGDGLPDMGAAKAAGVQSVAVEFGYAPMDKLRAAGANHTLAHYKDLETLLRSL